MKQIKGSIYKELVNFPTKKKTSFSDRYEQSVLSPSFNLARM